MHTTFSFQNKYHVKTEQKMVKIGNQYITLKFEKAGKVI